MTYGDLRRYADTLDVNVCSDILPDGMNGIYDDSIRTILIDRSLSYTQKRCTLVHELVHWSYYDAGCDPLRRAKSEARTRRITAQSLVSEKYAEILAAEYAGEPSIIANELDVTVSVLDDYMKLAMPRLHAM